MAANSLTTPGPIAELPARHSRLAIARDYGIVVSIVLVFAVLAATAPNFLTVNNLSNVAYQNAPLAIAAVGTTLVILGGAFDLSIGAVFALSGVMAAWLANHVDPAIGIVGGVVVGLVVGMANGVLVVAGLNSFLATLASSLVIRGLAVVITGGLLITVSDEAFGAIGKDDVLGLRYAIVALILVAGTLWFVTARTAFGRYVYAIGGNEEAARLSGVRVGLVRCGTFAISGGCAGLAGVLAASLASTGQADMGVGLELDAIAAVVIGGTSILGGVGAVWRTILGVFLLALVVNGFNLLNLPPYTQDIFTGTIIVAAIALNSLSGRR